MLQPKVSIKELEQALQRVYNKRIEEWDIKPNDLMQKEMNRFLGFNLIIRQYNDFVGYKIIK